MIRDDPMERQRRAYRVQGVVQGVGFRPFVYRIAVDQGLVGFVRNMGDAGVEISAEGSIKSLEAFERSLAEKLPPLAQIRSIDVEIVPESGGADFVIAPSAGGEAGRGAIPPDTAVCADCIADILGSTRYSDYWATSCTDCGPRFTVIEALPYDRPRTSMRDFPMCDACSAEYTEPSDRRYHAQTIACPVCGPRLAFDGTTDDAIVRAAKAIAAGRIVAIKGIGGTHIACDATNAVAVRELRRRLGRPGQAFALMSPIEGVDRFAKTTEQERLLLQSSERPIVILTRSPGVLPDEIAPGLDTVGVMLPYTGLHVLLFRHVPGPLVMTSANFPGRPMLIDDDRIRALHPHVVDHVLLHDRRIVARCDDSVVRVVADRPAFLRRSRGYVPQGVPADLGRSTVLALGPETGLTFTLYANRTLTPSQHIGSVDQLETYEFLQEAIRHFMHLLGVDTVDVVACDLHPGFMTTHLAGEIHRDVGAKLVPVQHHAAHLVSALAEHHLDEGVGIVLDGYGYGSDGGAWGGEVLVAMDRRIARTGSLRPAPLPGGDLAASYPLRYAASLLRSSGMPREEIASGLSGRGWSTQETDLLLAQIDRGINAPPTTSAGRFLDAVSAWLGVCLQRTYEGEPAMRLEAAAAQGIPFDIGLHARTIDGRRVLDAAAAFRELTDRLGEVPPEDIAAAAQEWLARGAAALAIEAADRHGIGTIIASGGVFYNQHIAATVRRQVERAGFAFSSNTAVPCGDGGISFGQAAFAAGDWHMEGA